MVGWAHLVLNCSASILIASSLSDPVNVPRNPVGSDESIRLTSFLEIRRRLCSCEGDILLLHVEDLRCPILDAGDSRPATVQGRNKSVIVWIGVGVPVARVKVTDRLAGSVALLSRS